MSFAGSQQRTFLALLARLRPHWRRDRNLPARIQSLITANRSFGSRDRRLYRELIYTALRYLPWIEPALDRDADLAVQLVAWLAADSAATEKFRPAVVAGWPACPRETAAKAREVQRRLGTEPVAPLPEWFRSHCPDAFLPEQTDALLARAPLWLRLQATAPKIVTDEFDRLGLRYTFSAVLPSALRVHGEPDLTKTAAYAHGLIEIQDLGSQLLLESAGIAPGERWLDACAGAGGKALQLSHLLGPNGHVDASDIRSAALAELAARAARAGIPIVQAGNSETGTNPPGHSSAAKFAPVRVASNPAPAYDGVLVDAPCSGSGTWRRAPHLKWTTTPQQIAEAAALQLSLLDRFSERVRPGGRLIYATCSLSTQENANVIDAFVATHPHFSVEPPARSFGYPVDRTGLTILPAAYDTDGFFVCTLRKT